MGADTERTSAFDDPRRSTAEFRLARMRAPGVVTDQEMSEFDAEAARTNGTTNSEGIT
jgi:hypothetical protein